MPNYGMWGESTSPYMVSRMRENFPEWGAPQQIWEAYHRDTTYFLLMYDTRHGVPEQFDLAKRCAASTWVLTIYEDGKYRVLSHYSSLRRPRKTPPVTWANRIINDGRPMRVV